MVATDTTAMTAGTGTPAVMTIPGISEELQARLAEGMARVDAALRAAVDHEDPFIREASSHLIEAGGKRVRPLLTSTPCCRCNASPRKPAAVTAPVVV